MSLATILKSFCCQLPLLNLSVVSSRGDHHLPVGIYIRQDSKRWNLHDMLATGWPSGLWLYIGKFVGFIKVYAVFVPSSEFVVVSKNLPGYYPVVSTFGKMPSDGTCMNYVQMRLV